MSENMVIGLNNRLPWHLPADWLNFRRVTEGKPFIMGRNSYNAQDKLISTYKSVILTHHKLEDLCDRCIEAHTIREALDFLKKDPEIFILGGQHVFEQTLHLSNYMYLTLIHAEIEGDAFFPEFDRRNWRLIRNDFFKRDKENRYDYTFLEYERR